jgi:hypothetical protein
MGSITMKTKLLFLVALTCIAVLSFAQDAAGTQPSTITGMSLNGATGLIATPTAQVGWEKSHDVGLDFGYHAVFFDDGITHIPKAALSLFKKGEIHVAYDSIGSDRYTDRRNFPKTDPQAVLFGGKFQFYKEGVSAVAMGGNFQYIDDLMDKEWNAGQVYLVATYAGAFFGMPAATSLTIGKSFSSKHNRYRLVENGDIDFSMGFELTLLPEVFKNYIQWINDFSNYSYTVVPAGSYTERRGSYNTGLRIDPVKNSQFKFVIDAILADVLDDDDDDNGGRSFILGLTLGVGLK